MLEIFYAQTFLSYIEKIRHSSTVQFQFKMQVFVLFCDDLQLSEQVFTKTILIKMEDTAERPCSNTAKRLVASHRTAAIPPNLSFLQNESPLPTLEEEHASKLSHANPIYRALQ